MKVVLHENLEWEPAQLVLLCRSVTLPFRELIQEQVVSWSHKRESISICQCSLSYLNVAILANKAIIQIEQLCEICLSHLVDAVPAMFPDAESLEVGYRNVVEPIDFDFLSIERKEIEFEDGRRELVSPFYIAKWPISVAEFERFVEKTHYCTDAEQDGSEETWRSNDFIAELSPRDRDAHPVVFVSYNDVTCFCDASSVRLPTEAEWLAASLVDAAVYPEGYARKAIYRASRLDDSLKGISDEYTATRLSDGRVVIRRGPKWARDVKWKERALENQIIVTPKEYHFGLAFRVCKCPG